ncbi:hypothetical protein L9F63_026903, partial [Diploptera punctata]
EWVTTPSTDEGISPVGIRMQVRTLYVLKKSIFHFRTCPRHVWKLPPQHFH